MEEVTYRYKCNLCPFRSRSKECLYMHQSRQHWNRRRICLVCKKSVNYSELYDHIKNLHPIKHCRDCTYKTRIDKNFNRHQDYFCVPKQKKFSCDLEELCGFQTFQTNSLTRHNREVHCKYDPSRYFSISAARMNREESSKKIKTICSKASIDDISRNSSLHGVPGPSNSRQMHQEFNIHLGRQCSPSNSSIAVGKGLPTYSRLYQKSKFHNRNISPGENSGRNSGQLLKVSISKISTGSTAFGRGPEAHSRATLRRMTSLEHPSVPSEIGVSTSIGTTQARTLPNNCVIGENNPLPVRRRSPPDLNYPVETIPEIATQKERAGISFLINPHIDPCLGSSANPEVFRIIKKCIVDSRREIHQSERDYSFPCETFSDLDYGVEETSDLLTEHGLTGSPFSNNQSVDTSLGNSENIERAEDTDSNETRQRSPGDFLSKIAKKL